MWSVQAGQCLQDLREHTHVVEAVAFAPDSANRSIAAATTTAAAAASLGAGAGPPPIAGTPSEIPEAVSNGTSARGSAGGEGERPEEGLAGAAAAAGWRYLASGSRDKTVKLWNATVGQCLMNFVSVGVAGVVGVGEGMVW